MNRTDVEFTSGGDTLRGWLYLPDGVERPPLVVMAHGFVGHREWVVPSAEVFTARGLACLVYDHPCFGASDGTPRQEVDPRRQLHGFRDAITFGASLPQVDGDRVALWGTSLAGALVLAAAALDGHRIRAVVSQVPAVALFQTFQRFTPAHLWPDLLAMLDADRQARFRGEPGATIPVYATEPGAPCALPGEDTARWLAAASKEVPGYRNEVTVHSIDLCFEFTPEAFFARVAPTPVFMTIAERDNLCVTAMQLAAYDTLHEPKQLHLIPGDHFAAYEDGFAAASTAQADFLVERLAH
jgi:uncharacterized protein